MSEIIYNVEPTKLDIKITREDTINLTFTVLMNGIAYDMTGMILEMIVKDGLGDIVKTLSTEGASPAITIYLNTFNILTTSMNDIGIYSYDVQLTNGTEVSTIQKGKILVVEDVTYTIAIADMPTVVTATIENATPEKVILTFDLALDTTSVPDVTAFTLATKTISLVEIADEVCTITVTVPYVYGDVVTINYTKPISNPLTGLVDGGYTASFTDQVVTNNINIPIAILLADGNTAGWYLADDLTTITKDGADLVSLWSDKLASGHNLAQANAAFKPLWVTPNIIKFDGVDDCLFKIFAYIQPEQIYLVVKQVTWTDNDAIIDGNGALTGQITQRTTTPRIRLYAGTALNNDTSTIGNWEILRALFNGANSSLQVNELAKATGNAGAANMGGIMVGANGGSTTFSAIEVKEMIFRKIADSAETETLIYNYLSAKYSI